MRSHVALARPFTRHTVLASSLVAALALAACGGDGAPQGPGPQVPTAPTAPTGPTPAGSAPAASGSAATAPAGAGTAGTGTPAPPSGPMKLVAASAMAEDLKKLGIDPLKPPPLNKLSPDVVRKLMPTFAKSLGVKCDACHDTNNFKASTPNKRIAAKMWQDFVVNLSLEGSGALYCDSCHGGKMEFLDRHDKKALSGWMDANFVSKLKRADKKEHSCEQCHGDPFEPKFIAQWSGSKG